MKQYNFLDIYKIDLQPAVLEDYEKRYYKNIFNYDVVNALSIDDKSKATPNFSKEIYNYQWKFFTNDADNFNQSKIDYKEVNSAIDMHQMSYYDYNHDNKKNKKSNDYLGIKNNVLLKNFIAFKDLDNDSGKEQNNKNYDNFKYIVTYNDMPIFDINKAFKPELKQLLVSNGYFISNNINSNTLSFTQIDQLFTNISTNYSLEKKENSKNRSNEYCIYPNKSFVKEKDDGSHQIYVIDTNGFKPTFNHFPSNNDSPALMQNGIYDAISLYNKNISQFDLNSNIDKNLFQNTKPTEFLMLFEKKDGTNLVFPKNLNYCETFMGIDNINLSLTSNLIDSKVAFNIKELNNLKERLQVFSQPTNVFFIFHNDNLVIKNKIEVNNETNPSYIDNPELVIQNALRTYGLPSETDHIMYLIGDKQYISLLNNVFVLYTFNLDNRQYYFDSYNLAKQKIIDYIKYNSFKI